MKPKYKRLLILFLILSILGLATKLVLMALEENIIYFKNNRMKNSKSITKTVEKQKILAETINGRFAMIGLIAAVGAYLTTGQIIPGFV